MSSRGLKLAISPEMQQNPSLELNNGESVNAMWLAEYPSSLSFLHFCLFCAPECYSNTTNMGVLSREETAGSRVHV
ncbi:hypothetical protein V6N13_123074 [Hibiscus sabdariffa]